MAQQRSLLLEQMMESNLPVALMPKPRTATRMGAAGDLQQRGETGSA